MPLPEIFLLNLPLLRFQQPNRPPVVPFVRQLVFLPIPPLLVFLDQPCGLLIRELLSRLLFQPTNELSSQLRSFRLLELRALAEL